MHSYSARRGETGAEYLWVDSVELYVSCWGISQFSAFTYVQRHEIPVISIVVYINRHICYNTFTWIIYIKWSQVTSLTTVFWQSSIILLTESLKSSTSSFIFVWGQLRHESRGQPKEDRCGRTFGQMRGKGKDIRTILYSPVTSSFNLASGPPPRTLCKNLSLLGHWYGTEQQWTRTMFVRGADGE